MSSSAIPTDSVLRRHYNASHEDESRAKQTTKNNPSQCTGGFFGWLKRIFS